MSHPTTATSGTSGTANRPRPQTHNDTPDDEERHEECGICLTAMRLTDTNRIALEGCRPAGLHALHGHCLRDWIAELQRTRRPATCPLCRAPVTQADIARANAIAFPSPHHSASRWWTTGETDIRGYFVWQYDE
jgi:hypothetical protein